MRFDARIPVASAAAATAECPDPASSPGTVPAKYVFELGFALGASQTPMRRILLALDGTAGETLTVELWAVDDATWPDQNADDPSAGLAARRFYRVGAAATTVTAKQVEEITAEVPARGRVYARVTGGTLASAGTLLIGGAA